jgi:hypothetical protein
MMNRKSNPREFKLKRQLEDFAKTILTQHDANISLQKENELLKNDKLQLLAQLQGANKLIGRFENRIQNQESDLQNLLDFKNKAIPMLEAYFSML